MTDFNRLFNDHADHEGFAIDTPEPPGAHWFEVANPFADNVAKRVGPKRAMQSLAQKMPNVVKAAGRQKPHLMFK